MIPDDHLLMTRIRARCADAFEELTARHAEALHRNVVSILRDTNAADDLVQEVWLRVWTRADGWDGRGAVKAWLFRIATNLALNHLRSVRRRREQSFDPPSRIDSEEEGCLCACLDG